MCRGLCGIPTVPPNRKCRLFTKLLLVMTVVSLLIAISAFVFGDIPQGIFAVMFVPLLFYSYWKLQYTILMAYAIVTIILYVMALAYSLGKYNFTQM